jgi:hypothetical protein
MVVGRQSASTGGIQLFNPKTKKFITRGTFKFLGEHPVKGILFESPIHIEISAGNDVPLTSLTQPLLPTQPIIPYLAVENEVPVTGAPSTVPSPIPEPALPARAEREHARAPPPVTVEPEPEALHYTMVRQKDVNRKGTRHLWGYIGKTFAETDENGGFVCLQRIVDVVATAAHPRTFFFNIIILESQCRSTMINLIIHCAQLFSPVGGPISPKAIKSHQLPRVLAPKESQPTSIL